jgi:hypothetical protein
VALTFPSEKSMVLAANIKLKHLVAKIANDRGRSTMQV